MRSNIFKQLNIPQYDDPSTDVDEIYDECVRTGRQCLFLHFTAPYHYVHTIRCPTVLVFAWEYDTIPTEHWSGDGANDWRAGLSAAEDKRPPETQADGKKTEQLEAPVQSSFYAKGVTYLTVLNPYDQRKNWRDMVTAYCMALKDTEDATLVIKVSVEFVTRFTNELIEHLRRLDRFSCRVAVIKAHLQDDAYDRLFLGSTYYVNTSFGEGQCLPLMRAMAAGIPCDRAKSYSHG